MGLFSTEKEIYVGGGISRVRSDEFIKRTTGYVVTGALAGEQNISEALTLNAITGTVGSYKSFWRRAEKKYGLPSGSFSYFTANEAQMASTIRSNTGQAFPSENDMGTIEVSTINTDFWIKYQLQQLKNYNITTNVLTHIGLDYYLDSYVNNTSKFTINAHRDKHTLTTITKAYRVFYDIGLTTWRVEEAVSTNIVWYYDPVGTSSDTTDVTYNYSDYDTINDPWELGVLVEGTDYYPCDDIDFNYLCDSSTTGSTEVTNISFDLNVVLPASTKDVEEYSDELGWYIIKNVPINYWHVTYTYNSRLYHWIGLKETYPIAIGDEVDIPTDLRDTFGSWAPIIPIRNNFVNYTASSNPTRYKKSKKLLTQIGLDISVVQNAITKNNPEINNLADAYVSMHSKLVSNDIDELSYNYAFFKALDGYGFANLVKSWSVDEVGDISIKVNRNILNVNFPGIYNQRISWQNIAETFHTGSLSKEYSASLAVENSGVYLETITGGARVTYVIRKKISATKYSQIIVNGFQIEFTVYADYTRTYSPSADEINDINEANQWVIPVSLALAQEAVAARDLETFFLRTTHIGMFSRQIVKIKWYQQSWFKFVLIIIVVVLYIYSGQDFGISQGIGAAAETGSSILSALGFTGAGIGASTAVIIAVGVGLAVYAVIAWAVKKLLNIILKAVGGNEFLQAIVAIAAIYVGYLMGGFKGAVSSITDLLNAYTENLKADINLASLEIKELGLELEELYKEVAKIDFKKDMQAGKDYLRYIFNLFANAGKQLTDHEVTKMLLLVDSPDYMYSYIQNAKRLPEPYESYLNTDRLVIA